MKSKKLKALKHSHDFSEMHPEPPQKNSLTKAISATAIDNIWSVYLLDLNE